MECACARRIMVYTSKTKVVMVTAWNDSVSDGLAYIPCLNAAYTGWPNKHGTVDIQSIFQDFALINSYLFSPCWIEHLFLIIITPRSSNWVENFLFYE